MSNNYDLIVIGGGSGGYAAAKKGTNAGLKVAVIDGADELGGLCILRGCMPTKALLETSNRVRAIQEAGGFGIEVAPPKVDIDALRARKKRLIDDFQHYRVKGLTKGDFELIRGKASFTSSHQIHVEGHGSLSAKYFVIATGSVEYLPPIEGLNETPFWTSDDIVELPHVPDSIAVIGSGAVGLESAFLFQGLGSKVTILSRSKPLVSDVPPEISKALELRCADLGIDIIFENSPKKIEHQEDTFTLTLENNEQLLCDQLIMAAGRKPNIHELGLSNAGFSDQIEILEISPHSQSAQPHIFGAGDCSSPLAVVHLALLQGEAAAENIISLLKGEDMTSTWEARLNMIGIFTDPEVFHLGLSDAEAIAAGYDPLTVEYRFDDQGKGEIVGEKHGLVTLTADRKSGEILGAAGMGPHVIDYAHTIMIAVHQRVTVADFIKIPSYHPTLGEIWAYVAEDLIDEL